MGADLSFIPELEHAIASGSSERRSQILQRVTDLFVLGSARFSEDDIALFDDVIGRLAAKIEQSAQVMLATRLAPIANSPPKTIRTLAFNDAIEVAGPVLSQSPRLDDETLVELASQKGQGHMLAIAHRPTLSEAVTTVLVKRGDRDVVIGTIGNKGAQFSDLGFAMLVQRSENDDGLAASLGGRPDIPPHMLLTLVARASETVREKLEAANPQAKEAVRLAVREAADKVQTATMEQVPEHATGMAAVERLQQSGGLNEDAIGTFASNGGFVETCAALAAMGELPLAFVEQAMASDRSENILIIARAVGLSWPTVKQIMTLRADKRIIAPRDIARALASYEQLRSQTAQEIVRFYRTRMRGQPARPA
ncbi:MAG: DUF2336 domain-containing protein [Xanthobacteraceae bacterium]|jgi:uncharacterized protein (DUF2336 family)